MSAAMAVVTAGGTDERFRVPVEGRASVERDLDSHDRLLDAGRVTWPGLGSGLGLAIVESVAVANGGRAWISDPPAGEAGLIVGLMVGPTLMTD